MKTDELDTNYVHDDKPKGEESTKLFTVESKCRIIYNVT